MTTTCLPRHELITWLGTDERARLLTALPPPQDIPTLFRSGKPYLLKLAHHLKGSSRTPPYRQQNDNILFLDQLSEADGARVSFSQWTGACLFRVIDSKLRPNQEFLVLERLAIGARTPLKILESEFCTAPACFPVSRTKTPQKYHVHIKVAFVSTWNFYAAEEDRPLVYLRLGHRLYHVRDINAFYLQYLVRESVLHPWENETGLRVRLSARYPQLAIPDNFLGSLKRSCFETDPTFRIVFFLAHSYLGADTLKSFQGLVRAGTWGGAGGAEQVVIVTLGTPTLRFLCLAPGAVNLSNYRPGKTEMQQKHLDPENLMKTESSSVPRDTNSPSQCPCQFGELFTRNLPPGKLSRPVGYAEAPTNLDANLQLLGLASPDLARILDVCTWLSCVCYDVER